MHLLQDLLINLLIILLFILIFSMLIWNKRGLTKKNRFQPLLFIFSSVLIGTSLFLSYEIDWGFKYDLRYIPFLIGSMYGGKILAIGLGVVLIITRFFFGGLGIWATIVIVGLSLIILLKLFPRMMNQPTKWRLGFTAAMSFLFAVTTYLIPAIRFQYITIIDTLIFFVILIGSTIFVTYLTEVFRTFYIYQQELIRSEKMKMSSHLAASISHEVKNPLTTVKGFLQLMIEDKNLTKENKEYATLAHDEVVRATNIITDYLTFAKPYHGIEIDVDIKDSILKCKDIMRPLANSANVVIETCFSHQNQIKGDPNRILQILLNLCKNSIEAMPTGGRLSITTTQEKQHIHICIKDTGSGISAEHLHRIGEPFFSTKKHEGTGLGLMVVFQLVKSMNGKIKVESEKNRGTTINITFPTI